MMIFWSITSQNRSGFFLVPGPMLGHNHGALNEIIQEAEEAKIKRSMYSETQKEREHILAGIRGSEWNAEQPPLVVTIQEPTTINHDFDKGYVIQLLEKSNWTEKDLSACHARVTLVVRNYSLTHSSRFVLTLHSGPLILR
jgi:trafficking protein particle complex subunit 8